MKKTSDLFQIGLVAIGLMVSSNLHAAPVQLSNTWQAFDPAGLLTLSGQSSQGFTATIATNTSPLGNAALSRIFQTFSDVPFTNIGTSVEVSFDVIFNDVANVGDTTWRFGLCNTNVNELISPMIDTGPPAGTSMRSRMGNRGVTKPGPITLDPDNPGNFEVTNWNNGFILSFNLAGDLALGTAIFSHNSVNGDMVGPNNIGLGQSGYLSTVQHFRYSVERIPGQLLMACVWQNTYNGVADFESICGEYDESNSTNTPVDWAQVNAFAFCCTGSSLFAAGSGSYTITNLTISTGYPISNVTRDPNSGDVALTWETTPYDSEMGVNYSVQYSTDLVSWTTLATLPGEDQTDAATWGYWASYTDSAPADQMRFYRIQRVYP
ncbi:MAG TPA: hypothetical protein VHG71_10305 [Verrucomicrobiae bacterium]|nr:hypothetical protein [Verrucomicrobiae bacterium]